MRLSMIAFTRLDFPIIMRNKCEIEADSRSIPSFKTSFSQRFLKTKSECPPNGLWEVTFRIQCLVDIYRDEVVSPQSQFKCFSTL